MSNRYYLAFCIPGVFWPPALPAAHPCLFCNLSLSFRGEPSYKNLHASARGLADIINDTKFMLLLNQPDTRPIHWCICSSFCRLISIRSCKAAELFWGFNKMQKHSVHHGCSQVAEWLLPLGSFLTSTSWQVTTRIVKTKPEKDFQHQLLVRDVKSYFIIL